MPHIDIKRELHRIYKERNKWDGAKGPFTKSAIERRELILLKQRLLYQMEKAELSRDNAEEKFNLMLYKLVDSYLKNLPKK